MRMEALLVGGSSGAAVAGALSWLTAVPGRDVEGQNVVIILPDGYVFLGLLGRTAAYLFTPVFATT